MTDESKVPDTATETQNEELLDTEATRRRMMMRLGIYTAVTAPVLLAALKAEKAVAQSGGPAIPGGGCIPSPSNPCPGGLTVF